MSSCDFVDRFLCADNKDDPRSHTNQHEPKHLRLDIDMAFLRTSKKAELKLVYLILFPRLIKLITSHIKDSIVPGAEVLKRDLPS